MYNYLRYCNGRSFFPVYITRKTWNIKHIRIFIQARRLKLIQSGFFENGSFFCTLSRFLFHRSPKKLRRCVSYRMCLTTLYHNFNNILWSILFSGLLLSESVKKSHFKSQFSNFQYYISLQANYKSVKVRFLFTIIWRIQFFWLRFFPFIRS